MTDLQSTVKGKNGREYFVSTVQMYDGYQTCIFNDEGVEVLKLLYTTEESAITGHSNAEKFVEGSGLGLWR